MGKHDKQRSSGSSSKHDRPDKQKAVDKTINFDESSDDEENLKNLKKHTSGHHVEEAKEIVEEITPVDEDVDEVTDSDGDTSDSDSEASDSDSSNSGSDDSDDAISLTSTEILNSDPLFTVLSQFFVTKDGKNIAEVLDEINSKLKYLKVR